MYIPAIKKIEAKDKNPNSPDSPKIRRKSLSTARLTEPYPLPKKIFLLKDSIVLGHSPLNLVVNERSYALAFFTRNVLSITLSSEEHTSELQSPDHLVCL